MTDKKSPLDELLRTVRNAEAMTDKGTAKPDEPRPSTDDIKQKAYERARDNTFTRKFARATLHEAGIMGRDFYNKSVFIRRAYDTVAAIFNSKTLAVLTLGATWLAKKYWQGCKYAFKKYAMDGLGNYNAKKGAVAAVGIGLVTIFNLNVALPALTEIAVDGIVYNVTSKELEGRLTLPTRDPDDPNGYTTNACELKDRACTPDDNIPYQIKDSLYLDLHALFTRSSKGTYTYRPSEDAGSIVASGISCKYTSWGTNFKFAKRYLASAKMYYPKCDPASVSYSTVTPGMP